MAMAIVDTIMVGRLGAEAIGAVSIGSVLFFSVAISGMGMLLGMDPMVAQAYGAGRFADCHRTLIQSIYLSLVLAPAFMALLYRGTPWLDQVGIQPAVVRLAVPYLKALSWCMVPLFLYGTLRRYLQAIGLVKPVMLALLSANVVNLAGNWALIYGHLGMPALGVVGSGWATTIARVWLFLVLLIVLIGHAYIYQTGLFRVPLGIDLGRLRKVLALGMPASAHLTLETAVFAVVTALAGRFSPEALAAHQIVLCTASLTYMVPLGVSAAGAVRVGHAIGRRDPQAASRAGWTALALGAGFMAAAALVLLLIPRTIMGVFTQESAVISAGLSLLYAAAVFQLFDGLQVVASGILRGTGETRIPMFCNLVAYWGLGLPVAYMLGVWWGLGVLGLWIGLVIALIVAGLFLLYVWAKKARGLVAVAPAG
ncbi:MAG TPA: MATE family efflux transporter, partial [Isosphaeraceae bacterium]|nr:MATE family efflux transporter [Isosphaeraceae bacterium]